MSDDFVRLTVTDIAHGAPCVVTMSYRRELWEDVTEHDREQLRLIARARYGGWFLDEFGFRLSDAHLDALPVTAG
ncbi:hypothetical protein [Streptomyces goshikiensis]|uniref:hypothetical protein n=1 Tax=Streptomyces goshikiensis TaxID=1942 RepID=UPI00371E076D